MPRNTNLFTKHTQKSMQWVREVNALMGLESPEKAFGAIRAVLHQLRDNLPVIEAVHLSAQLPLVLKGVYFENWNPSHTPFKERQIEQFLEHVKFNLQHYWNQEVTLDDAENATYSVLNTLAKHIDEGELEKVRKLLPKHVKDVVIQSTDYTGDSFSLDRYTNGITSGYGYSLIKEDQNRLHLQLYLMLLTLVFLFLLVFWNS